MGTISVFGGRLECTMQYITDNLAKTCVSRFYKGVVEDKRDTFIMYNERRKVTSSAMSKKRHSDNSLHQTQDGVFLDILQSAYDLLSRCAVELPQIQIFEIPDGYKIMINPPDESLKLYSKVGSWLCEGIAQNPPSEVFVPEDGGDVGIFGSPTRKSYPLLGSQVGDEV
ncbi:hypothetical protein SADUNF_Sadunf04G0071600 [Salix dunnii]|uniref:Uncharacterized protein n=1 Tax=Salix dunnii TaxID=1413687 RepID=A0A835N3X9_9ROSI|nr:hypothetical protein SADUNF_Sadunf04G0071600 [Salix dunnii]